MHAIRRFSYTLLVLLALKRVKRNIIVAEDMVRVSLPAFAALCCIVVLQAAPVQLANIEQLGSSSFYIGETSLNWDDAIKACEEQGYQLAQLDTQAKQDELSSQLITRDVPNWYMYWIAGRFRYFSNEFYWADSEDFRTPFCYTFWGPGQPDPRSNNENCVILWNADYTFEWHDLDCATTLYFICESKSY